MDIRLKTTKYIDVCPICFGLKKLHQPIDEPIDFSKFFVGNSSSVPEILKFPIKDFLCPRCLGAGDGGFKTTTRIVKVGK